MDDTGALLRFVQRPNRVSLGEGEAALKAAGRYSELVALYQERGQYSAALDLLRTLSLVGCDPIRLALDCTLAWIHQSLCRVESLLPTPERMSSSGTPWRNGLRGPSLIPWQSIKDESIEVASVHSKPVMIDDVEANKHV